MWVALVILHIMVGIALIGIVLLQTGKGADMGAAFGGTSSQTLFGSSGPGTFLGKLTTVAAIIFMLTSFTLAYMSSGHRGGSIMTGAGSRQVSRPAVPTGPSPVKPGGLMEHPAKQQAPAPGQTQQAPPAPAGQAPAQHK